MAREDQRKWGAVLFVGALVLSILEIYFGGSDTITPIILFALIFVIGAGVSVGLIILTVEDVIGHRFLLWGSIILGVMILYTSSIEYFNFTIRMVLLGIWLGLFATYYDMKYLN